MSDRSFPRLLFLFGTRPEAIKLCPVFLALQQEGLPYRAVNTGQHRDMVEPVLRFFHCRADRNLAVLRPDSSLLTLTQQLLGMLPAVLNDEKPDVVVVHGDTATAHAGMLCAYLMGIRVCHIEAGLRTGHVRSPYPEEFFRVAIDSVSDICFAPTAAASDCLLREGKSPSRVILTGNTATDAVRLCLADATNDPNDPNDPNALLRRLCPLTGTLPLPIGQGKRIVLLTAHRRETDSATFLRLFEGIAKALRGRDDVMVIFPVHPAPKMRQAASAAFAQSSSIYLVEPLELPLMQQLLAHAALLLTDSGGMQEEAVYLGIPTLVLRKVTERAEGVEAGVLRAVGTDGGAVADALTDLLDHPERLAAMAHPDHCFGDGYAAQRIVAALKRTELFS